MNKGYFEVEPSLVLHLLTGITCSAGRKELCLQDRRMLPVRAVNMGTTGARGGTRNKNLKLPFTLIFLFLCGIVFPARTFSQQVGLHTNVLYWATTTPNVGVEWRLSSHYTLSATVGYNAFNFPNRTPAEGDAVNPKLHHWLVMPEAKYWFCRAYERHYVGFHALYGQYNIGGLRFPAFLSDARYRGWGAGAGISYGYQWALGKRWGVEASVGVGYVYLNYDKYECGACGDKIGSYRRHWIGPTKAAVSFIYYIR